MKAQERCGSKFPDCWLHVFTLRNLLFNCISMVLRVTFHPDGVPFLPSRTMENVSEQHFAAKKVGVGNASPTLAACLWSTQKVHLRQLVNPTKPPKVPTSTNCSLEDAQKILLKSFHVAARFESITSVNQKPESLRRRLVEYLVCWVHVGLCVHVQGRRCFLNVMHQGFSIPPLMYTLPCMIKRLFTAYIYIDGRFSKMYSKELFNPRAVNMWVVMYFRLHYQAESCIYAVKTLSCKLALDLR